MPTSSGAHRSAASSAGSRRTDSARTKSASKSTPASSARRSTRAPGPTTKQNDDDTGSNPPLSTTEIIEKATVSLVGLSARDSLTVWKALGLYLSDQLVQRHRVVSVDRFGVFGHNDAQEAVFVHTSVFLQSNRLKEKINTQGLRGQPALAATSPPMSKVNTAEIGQEYLQNCGREMVDSVIANVVAYIGKMAKQGRAMRLSVLPLGEWICTGDTVQFTFLAEFQQQMVKSSAKTQEQQKTDVPPKKAVDSSREQPKNVEPRPVETSLTPQQLEAHTTQYRQQEAPPSWPKQQSDRRSKTTSDSQRRVAWSEPESGNQREERTAKKTAAPSSSKPRSKQTADKEGDIVSRVKSKLIERCGDRGLNALQRVLSLMDTSGDGQLSSQELKFGLRDLGIELTATELRQVVSYFDRNNDGVVSLDELLHRLRNGKLSDKRRALVLKAFDCVDSKRRGIVSLDALKDNYDVSLLPRVRAGKKTKAQALAEFLREWELSVDHDDGIPRDAFVEYYHNVSACIPDDSDFELLMRQTWHVSSSESEPESSSEDEAVVMTPASPARTTMPPTNDKSRAVAKPTNDDELQYLRSQLLPPSTRSVHTQPTLDDMCRRLGANRVWGDSNESMNTRAFANALCIIDRQLHSKDAQHLARLVADCCGSGMSDMISLGDLYRNLVKGTLTHVSGTNASSNDGNPVAHDVIERIRSRLLQRLQSQESGESVAGIGLNVLARTLKLMDSNNDKRLSKDELKVGLRKLGVEINFHELDHLFTCLDADRSGCIDTDEFLVAMRGQDAMNATRLKFVHMAFDRLDRDRDGSVTLDELSKAYDTSKHPEVLAGRMTPQQAIRQFAQQWDTIDRDGVISRKEFEMYYRNVSACIDQDDYFELMMRNAWHISGGSGQSANTSNRRVLVTKTDGSQSVHEIKDDLGIRATDTAKIQENLRTQGVIAHEIHMHGRIDDKVKDKALREPPRLGSKPTSTLPVPQRREEQRQLSARQPREEPPQQLVSKPSDFFASSGGGSEEAAAKSKELRARERRVRERAALMIQAHFRGFKSRKFIDCVRRKMAAEEERKARERQEQDPRKRVISRAPLKSYYGF